jgi:transposase-like protein
MLKEKRGYVIDRFYKRFSEKTKSSRKQYSKKDRRENKVRLLMDM